MSALSGFAFVPRKVARASKPAVNGAGIASVSAASIDKGKAREIPPLHAREHQPQPASASASTSTSKPPYPDAEFPALLCLSLSQYRLWLDPDLRRDIARCTRVRANDGFFPLRYLLDTPCPLAATRAPEAALAKALRAHGAAVVDVRMAVPSDGALSSNQKRGGAFEIRPRFWDDADADAASYPTSRVGWDGRTVYVENMPAECKTLPAVCRFILALLPPAGALAAYTRIQGITSPAHHSDEPGVEPKLKSFALVTFARAADAEALLAAFPWQRTREPRRRAEAQARETADAAEGAARVGFRACSKARWDALNAEYLAYRARILADMKQAPEEEEDGAASEAAPRARPGPSAGGSAMASARRGAGAVADTAPVAPALPYPPNCLVFVRNIDPETNKTALRGFFAHPLGADADAADAIDYVDFNKGMDSCYLRLTAAAHARRLVDHFAGNPTVHARAGATGSGGGGNVAVAVAAELVQGTREGVYWERVPERVRAQAVQRARGLARGDGSGGAAVLARDGGGEGGAGRERKRRRR